MTYPTIGHDRKYMNNEKEVWKIIKDFPNYDVSNFGNIANKHSDNILEQSTTKQGALKIGLVKNGKQLTRSVKVIVAETFVQGKNEIFNTPILLDGNQLNCYASNILWRPRWYAWNYSFQFNDVPDFYFDGPVLELNCDGIILLAYNNVYEAAVKNGLLFHEVWKSIHTKKEVFPTKQFFTLPNKV